MNPDFAHRLEITQAAICIAGLAVNLTTLRTVCRTRRYVLQSGMNHGADLYTRLMVFDGVAMLCVQIFCVIATVQFIGVSRAVPKPLFFGVFYTGLLRTATSIIVATVAFARWWIYRKACRNEK